MAKKRSVIRRVYKQGKETTVFTSAKRASSAKRRSAPKQAAAAKKVSHDESFLLSRRGNIQKSRLANSLDSKPSDFSSVASEEYELPSKYNSTYLTILVRDPFWIYAYWEVAQKDLKEIESRLANGSPNSAVMVIRMYDVSLIDFDGTNANSWFDIEVGRDNSNWHINLWSGNSSYIADLGLRAQDGRFFVLARSNNVQTPRMSYSPRSEQVWMQVKGNGCPKTYIKAAFPKKEASCNTAAKVLAPAPAKRKFFLTEEEIRAYYSRMSPLLRDVIASRLGRRYGKKIKNIGLSNLNRFTLEGTGQSERARLLSWLPQGLFIGKILKGASEILVLLEEDWRFSGSAQSSEAFYSSEASFKGPRQRNFFFELWAELTVYGRTETDAKVYLADKHVSLRPDGTFTMRFALPDGNVPLEFKAVSADKIEERRIHTYVDRYTRYL